MSYYITYNFGRSIVMYCIHERNELNWPAINDPFANLHSMERPREESPGNLEDKTPRKESFGNFEGSNQTGFSF